MSGYDTKICVDNQRRNSKSCILSDEFCILWVSIIRFSIYPTIQHFNVTSFRAYAKINLGLLVLEKRPDGYHDIETVFHRINLYDEIGFSPSSNIIIESSSKEPPSDERNICFKSAELLRRHLGINAGVKISIQKKIPVGAGLGGGSSDAATVLRHLPSFWGKTVSEDGLLILALQLGSDVPYFLHSGSALARGRGEALATFHLDVPYTILLCNPGIHISTAWAYQHVQPQLRQADLKELVRRGMQNSSQLAALTNDFESAVFTEYPAVKEVKERMLRNGAVFSLMSGSGSTVYGLFDDEGTARKAAADFNALGFRAFLTEPHFSPAEP